MLLVISIKPPNWLFIPLDLNLSVNRLRTLGGRDRAAHNIAPSEKLATGGRKLEKGAQKEGEKAVLFMVEKAARRPCTRVP
jgi:hypothetical protein